MAAPEPEPPEILPRNRPIVSLKELALQLLVVTAGVLIALLLESLVEWNHYRKLVIEARQTLAREIADNKKEIASMLAAAETARRGLEESLKFADDLLATGKTDVRTLNLTLNLADLSAASWQSAERTGALAHMDYNRVQEYSRLYGLQELVAAQQRRALERLTLAIGILGQGDPDKTPPKDLEAFRQHVLALGADVTMTEQLARQLVDNYQKMIAR